MQVRVKQDELARYGVPAQAVLDLVESLGGKPVGEVVRGPVALPAGGPPAGALRGEPGGDRRPCWCTTPAGERVPLSRLADGRASSRGRRRSCASGASGGIVGAVQRPRPRPGQLRRRGAAARSTREVKLPTGRYRIEWGGQFENLERAKRRLLIVVPVALALIFVLLYLTYNRLRDVLLVFTAVPFACVGGVLALWLRELPFSISAGVGFIALSGVSVLNSMVLVTFIRQLREQGLAAGPRRSRRRR